MQLIDANVLINVARKDAVDHARMFAWLDALLRSGGSFALADIVAAAFIRITTNSRIYTYPSTLDESLAFIDDLRSRPGCSWMRAGERHWSIFSDLCKSASIKGPMVTDAWLAALAIEHGCELISADRDFARFAALVWRHPLDPSH